MNVIVGGFALRFPLPHICASAVLLACGCAAHHVSVNAASVPQAPAVVSGAVRETLPNDYLRVGFLKPGMPVSSIARPGAIRGFATATSLFTPPLKVGELPYYSGIINDDSSDLVAMRCQPPHPEAVDAVLATWPNVFAAIVRDVPVDEGACSASQPEVRTQVACYAKGFHDSQSATVPGLLAHTFDYAGVLFDKDHTAQAKWLKDNYGIFPAFAGTGYSVKDSYYLDNDHPMTSQQILVKSISSEYVLKNVSLAEAGCRCIRVPPYAGRADDHLDPEFITRAGGEGSCVTIDHLPAK
jgi:hypothetical protein